VRSAVDGVDVVREREDVLRVGVVVLEGDLDHRRPVSLLAVDRPAVDRFLVPVEMADERDEAALEVERALAIEPLIAERDPDALREVGRLAEALRDQVERVLRRLEHLGIGPEPGRRPAAIAGRPDLLDRRRRLAPRIFLGEDLAVTGRLDPHPFRQGVDDADADAVEAAGHLVPAATELTTGVEDRVNDLEGVLAGRVPADRHAATVVDDRDHVVLADGDVDLVGVAGHRLVDRVVDDFPDEVVQPAGIRRADVHARPSANGFEALEDLDAGRGVVRARRLLATCAVAPGDHGRGGFLGHAAPPIRRSYSWPSSSSL
jgi:hypothetical protein